MLILSRNPSLSSIAPSRSSKPHLVSAQGWYKSLLVHRRMLLMSSSLLRQYPACLACLTRMVCEMSGKWPYNCYFVGCCFQDLFKTARSILMKFSYSLFLMRFVNVHVVHPYSSMNTATAWKESRFILSNRSDFHIIDILSIAVHVFTSLTPLSVDEILLPRYLNSSTNFNVFLLKAHILRFICLYVEADASRGLL